MTDGHSDAFASGPPAAGRNQLRPGTHGATEPVHGSTVDRSGGDASTTGSGMGSDSTESAASISDQDIPDNAAAGEISSDEVGGQGGR
jgi:hypothetical protein